MLTDEKVRLKANDWAAHWKNDEPAKMDNVLVGKSDDDRRRIVLCGQRIALGLSPRVVAPIEGREVKHTNGKETKHGRTASAEQGAGKTAKGASVGTGAGNKKVGSGGKGASDKKQSR